MGQRPNCRSCTHCTPPQDDDLGWCQMRRLPIHPELAAELWCHHWTARTPTLLCTEDRVALAAGSGTRQLDLADLLTAC